jgi:hypothetical protein
MGILSIALKERSKNGLCRIAIAFDRMVMIFFYGICKFCFICSTVASLQYSKSASAKK